MKRLVLLLSLVVAIPFAACSIPPSDGRIGINGPSENIGNLMSTTMPGEWRPVADYMGDHCGGLDCHGSTARNFIVWSCWGLRLAADAYPQPGCFPHTTPAEYDATYRSLVGLEPNVMSVVVAGGGANPDLLTFIRKARGEENHKGGTPAPEGSPADVCMTSWLTGTTNVTACVDAYNGIDGGTGP